MIVFDLACGCGVCFEGWFRDHADFDTQARKGLLRCPSCGGSAVHKILSPVASVRRSGADLGPLSAPPEVGRATLTLLRAVRQLVETHCEDVGHGLAQEAMKIHFGDAAPRNLRGVTTPEEEQLLQREGIELLKLPELPPEDEVLPQ